MSVRKPVEISQIEALTAERDRFREENARLRAIQAETFAYIRAKVNDMLAVVGTKTLRPEELDDQSLLEFDPIGIVTKTFRHVLDSHRKLNEELHFAHDEIQAIFDSVGAALLVLDPKGRVQAYNQKTKELLLGRDEDIVGRSCCTICGRKQGDGSVCTFEKVMQVRREHHLQDWSLGERTFSVVGRPMLDAAGEITHVVLAYSDITARKKAETSLLESLKETQEANAKIHGILRSAADSLLVTDASDNIVLMNERAEQLFGFCLTHFGGKLATRTFPCREFVDLLCGPPQSGSDVLIRDLVIKGVDGEEGIYQARVAVVRGPGGDYRGRIALLHDVTRDRELDRMKSDFVSTAAHELRTPLSTILGYTDLMLTQGEQSREHFTEYLTLIQDKAENLAQIVGDLLDISRIEAGDGLQLSFEPCDLEKVCRNVVEEISIDIKTHQFALDFPDKPILIEADRYALVQILENVLGNAVKYSPGGGEVQLAARVEGNLCRLSISDTGLGMQAGHLERVFEKFYRIDTTNTAISGTGLGLTIVKHLVEAHRGSIYLESQPGQGTTVKIELPMVQ